MSKLSRNAAKRVFASAPSPAKNTSRGLSSARTPLENRIECLNDVCALGGGGGDLLGHRVALGSHDSAGVGVERVGDVERILPASASP